MPNLHATALVLDQSGMLIIGASGSGKTTLALHLIEAWRSMGRFACLVSDDQIFPEVFGRRLVATAPEAISGLVEIWGKGPARVASLPSAVIDLVVELVTEAPRLQEPGVATIAGIDLPVISLAPRNAEASRRAIEAALRELTPA